MLEGEVTNDTSDESTDLNLDVLRTLRQHDQEGLLGQILDIGGLKTEPPKLLSQG